MIYKTSGGSSGSRLLFLRAFRWYFRPCESPKQSSTLPRHHMNVMDFRGCFQSEALDAVGSVSNWNCSDAQQHKGRFSSPIESFLCRYFYSSITVCHPFPPLPSPHPFPPPDRSWRFWGKEMPQTKKNTKSAYHGVQRSVSSSVFNTDLSKRAIKALKLQMFRI